MTSSCGVHVCEWSDAEGGIADQLGEDAAGAEGDQWAEDGVLDEAGEELGAASDHRLNDHRRADPVGRFPDGGGVAEVERDSAALALVDAGGGGLDDDGVAEGDGGFDRLLGRVRHFLADERDPVGQQEGADVGRLEPDIVSIG